LRVPRQPSRRRHPSGTNIRQILDPDQLAVHQRSAPRSRRLSRCGHAEAQPLRRWNATARF
jgi:hypothetical protein